MFIMASSMSPAIDPTSSTQWKMSEELSVEDATVVFLARCRKATSELLWPLLVTRLSVRAAPSLAASSLMSFVSVCLLRFLVGFSLRMSLARLGSAVLLVTSVTATILNTRKTW